MRDMTERRLIAGNWKMNGTHADLGALGAFARLADEMPGVDVALALPSTLIFAAAQLAGDTPLAIGGEDCHHEVGGAHTGCVSAPMLAAAGATFTLVGHSERRTDQGETDDDVRAKVEAARGAGLGVILCVGETEAQRDAGEAETVVARQLSGSIPNGAPGDLTIAYEPVWAIGTGRTPTIQDVAAMHDHIRGWLSYRFGKHAARIRILYGGSVKGSNAAELLAVGNVDGALVGGASLKSDDFRPIVEAAG